MSALNPAQGPAYTERRCIVSGLSMPTDRLVRFVVGPGRDVVPDIRGKLGGRGIWVGAARETIESAVDRNLFSRAARASVTVSDDLAQIVERQLLGRVQAQLSLARKAGQAVAGFEKVCVSLNSGDCALLLMAEDATENAQKKIPALESGVELLDCLSGSELGFVFGRERNVHVAVADGGLADQIKIDGRRLAEFRGKPSLDEVRHDAEV